MLALRLLIGVISAVAQPTDWQAAINAGRMLCTADEPAVDHKFMPAVGNGYLATQIGSDSIYVAGVYNGEAVSAPSHRARIPSTG
jgi:hypothetical protein